MEKIDNQKSLAQPIGEAAAAQCKECDGKGWTVSIDKHITYPQCQKCSGRGQINTYHAVNR